MQGEGSGDGGNTYGMRRLYVGPVAAVALDSNDDFWLQRQRGAKPFFTIDSNNNNRQN